MDHFAETDNREVTCRACGGPLEAREEGFVLKYFLLRKALPVDPRSRAGQRAKPAASR